MDDCTVKPGADWTTIEAVRRRPGMYIGDVGEHGLITYLIGAIQLLLDARPSRLAFVFGDGGFVVEANAPVSIEATAKGALVPFEEIQTEEISGSPRRRSYGDEGTFLNALSERLTVEIRRGCEAERLIFRQGVRDSWDKAEGPDGAGTTLRFTPDASIFRVAEVAPAILRTYLKRLSFLRPGVRFAFSYDGETREYHAPRGLLDLFDAVSAPSVLLHEPIHFVARDGELRVEAAFAHQNRRRDDVRCFLNDGVTVAGGTHEQGLREALAALSRDWKNPGVRKADRPGLVGVVSIRYPDVNWEGATKDRVSSPELREKVRDLLVRGASEWLRSRPDVFEALKRLQTFNALETWLC